MEIFSSEDRYIVYRNYNYKSVLSSRTLILVYRWGSHTENYQVRSVKHLNSQGTSRFIFHIFFLLPQHLLKLRLQVCFPQVSSSLRFSGVSLHLLLFDRYSTIPSANIVIMVLEARVRASSSNTSVYDRIGLHTDQSYNTRNF